MVPGEGSHGLISAGLCARIDQGCEIKDVKAREPRRGIQGASGVGSREREAHGIGTGCRPWRASDNDPQGKPSLPEGAAGIFGRGGRAAGAAKVAEEAVGDLRAGIGEQAVASGVLSRKPSLWPADKARHPRTDPSRPVGQNAQHHLLSVLRLSFWHKPTGETEMNFDLMRLIGRQFADTPFDGIPKITWYLQKSQKPWSRGPGIGAARLAMFRIQSATNASCATMPDRLGVSGIWPQTLPWQCSGRTDFWPQSSTTARIRGSAGQGRSWLRATSARV